MGLLQAFENRLEFLPRSAEDGVLETEPPSGVGHAFNQREATLVCVEIGHPRRQERHGVPVVKVEPV